MLMYNKWTEHKDFRQSLRREDTKKEVIVWMTLSFLLLGPDEILPNDNLCGAKESDPVHTGLIGLAVGHQRQTDA